ncbi:hypothetical protein AVEN_57186-1 [Araneus ventricosus]|uniref:Uncharacterized protein n=1 Tax=Araneus ventricosus TaxID=182803 RepID=A0A4Y2SM45_ARAVE|nr:hypothetical protein AVEN_57186-1 [Araneus ventricosus]
MNCRQFCKGGLKSFHPLLFRDYFPRTIFAEKSPKQGGEAGASLSPLVRRKKAGLSLFLPCDRQSSTFLSRLASCHLEYLTYSEGNKIYPLCPKCQQHQASPKHILTV